MEKGKDLLERILEWGMFISFMILILIVTASVVTRFCLPFIVISWAEEASRFFFIYTVALGAPCAFKKKEFAVVDFIFLRFSRKVQVKLNTIFNIVTAFMFFLIFLYSLQFAKLGLTQYSPTMGIPMVFAYSSMVLTSLFMTVYSVRSFVESLRERGDI